MMRLDEREKAVFHYRKALEINPRHRRARNRLSTLLWLRGDKRP